MPQFLVLYHNHPSADEKMAAASPDDMAAVLQQWGAWGERCGDGIVEMGNPVARGHDVTNDGAEESPSTISGYSVIQADDTDGALALLDGHPHLDFDESARIEIHQITPIPM